MMLIVLLVTLVLGLALLRPLNRSLLGLDQSRDSLRYEPAAGWFVLAPQLAPPGRSPPCEDRWFAQLQSHRSEL